MSVRVLLIDDEADTLLPNLAQHLEHFGFGFSKEAVANRALQTITAVNPDVVLLDLHFPGDDRRPSGQTTGGELLPKILEQFPQIPILVFTSRLKDMDIPLETFDKQPHGFFAKPDFGPDDSWKVALTEALRAAISTIQSANKPANDLGFHVGETPAMGKVAAMVHTASLNKLNVLIYGESGTGKQLLAESIHRRSERWNRRFEHFNCSGVDEQTLEDTLFGHEPGAYTGARGKREGLFELADGGTLFLDEIQRMPMALQDKLMLVIETGRVRRMGANEDRLVDVRLIAATNHSLNDLVADAVLREDLAWRISAGLMIFLPPLRERMNDIPALFELFVTKANNVHGRYVSTVLRPETQALLDAHDWPGNIRELEGTLTRAVVTTTSNVLLPGDISIAAVSGGGSREPAAPTATATGDVVAMLAQKLWDLPIPDRHPFILTQQDQEVRGTILKDFLWRLYQLSGTKITYDIVIPQLCDLTNVETGEDFTRISNRIRGLFSEAKVLLTDLEWNRPRRQRAKTSATAKKSPANQ